MPFSWQCPLKFPPTASTEIFLNFCHKTEENKFLKQRVDNCGAAIALQRPRIRQMTKLHKGAVYNKRIFHSSLSQNWTEIPGRKNPPLPHHIGRNPALFPPSPMHLYITLYTCEGGGLKCACFFRFTRPHSGDRNFVLYILKNDVNSCTPFFLFILGETHQIYVTTNK